MDQKKKYLLTMLPLLTGLIILTASLIVRQFYSMSDFMKGFFEGMSGVFIVIGLILFGFNLPVFLKQMKEFKGKD